jgi:hypothetical protein
MVGTAQALIQACWDCPNPGIHQAVNYCQFSIQPDPPSEPTPPHSRPPTACQKHDLDVQAG